MSEPGGRGAWLLMTLAGHQGSLTTLMAGTPGGPEWCSSWEGPSQGGPTLSILS